MSKISVEQHVITSAAAAAAISAAVAEAERMGVRVNVAVVDSSGVLCAFLRMPGAFIQSVEIAIDKARTSAGFGMPSRAIHDFVKENRPLELGLMARAGTVLFAGGLPLMDGTNRIGGIGVSGGSEEEDVKCAQAAIKAIEALAR